MSVAEGSGGRTARLTDRGRLAAVAEVGLSAEREPGMERFARLVVRMLDVPMALVSLVEAGRQVLPGQFGLPEPWATRRAIPVPHALCHLVVEAGEPLVLPDARADERTGGSPAIDDLGLVAYAGLPLADEQGRVLGVLAAVDTRPRAWTDAELADLADLAAACGVELRLRRVTRRSIEAREAAELGRLGAERAQRVAERAGEEALHVNALSQEALRRAELLLRAAEDLGDTSGLADVRRTLRDLVSGDLKPSYVGLVVAEGASLRRIPDPDLPNVLEDAPAAYPRTARRPSATAVAEGRPVIIADRAELAAGYGPDALRSFDALGLRTAVCMPLRGAQGVLGALELGWDRPYTIDVQERAVLTTIAGYAAQALERAVFLDERVSTARRLQQAMLTDLPPASGLEIAALYRPAADRDMVGGDWYDAYPLPGGAGADAGDAPRPLAVTVGDITGHDMAAATIMGQARAMLRQAEADHPGAGPSRAVDALEHACASLPLDATGTLVHAHLTPAGSGSWELTWTNAGHPPALLALPRGGAEQLTGHDRLFWPGLAFGPRTDHRRVLTPGATVLLYTDGLVERPGESIGACIDRTAGLLADLLAEDPGRPLDGLLESITDTVAGPHAKDDVVLLAVRVPGA
ncbi:SpoIIE family protein phosphatase [Actinomadura parmotrematis]|uniref:SpoIIE family protein phosphatase n=1 Tax=Actinomadura parmotrematis TaxID=2864039 RepID=A0ABS7FZ51_9ACTN|nr:SpoIIE family protein phosphatase [Actinomadura parmotrematis]MBW8485728.1 SpoIIE family protein phosphatase [Actinomadura parmotrematis]